jgi:hypothetical protein
MRAKKPLKQRPRRKRAKAKTHFFQLTAPGSGSILDAAEDAMIAKAIAKAAGGQR